MELKIGIQKNWFQKGCITFNKITLGCSKQGQFSQQLCEAPFPSQES